MNDGIETKEVLETLKALIASGHKNVSISMIQRRMRTGFNLSANIMDRLIEGGAVIKIDSKFELAPEFYNPDTEQDDL